MNCILIDKRGTLKEINIKNDNIDYLLKKCGFKTMNSFEEKTCWRTTIKQIDYQVKVFGKTEGKANSENKYDFPPPMDNVLLFGSCILINYKNDQIHELSISEWDKIYEKLFGGFEDLATTAIEDENEVDELDTIDDSLKTQEGYLKDGFVVDDSNESNESESLGSELTEEPYIFSDEEEH